MKKIIIILTAIILLTWPAYAFESSVSSGEQTADALIVTGGGFLTAFEVITDGTNDAKIVIYDNTSASGKVLNEITVNGSNHFAGREPPYPPEFFNGIYVDVTGTGASYIIETIQSR